MFFSSWQRKFYTIFQLPFFPTLYRLCHKLLVATIETEIFFVTEFVIKVRSLKVAFVREKCGLENCVKLSGYR